MLFDQAGKVERVLKAAFVGDLPDGQSGLGEHGDAPLGAEFPQIPARREVEFAPEMVDQRTVTEPRRLAGSGEAILLFQMGFHVAEGFAQGLVEAVFGIAEFRQTQKFREEEDHQLVNDAVGFGRTVWGDLEERGEEAVEEFGVGDAERGALQFARHFWRNAPGGDGAPGMMGVMRDRVAEILVVTGIEERDGFDLERFGRRAIQFHLRFAGMEDDEFVVPLNPGASVAAGLVNDASKMKIARSPVPQMRENADTIVVLFHGLDLNCLLFVLKGDF